MQQSRHLVDRVDVPHADHAVRHHVGEQRDLFAFFVGHLAVGAAQQHVGLDADLAQLLHRVLGRLGLEFTGCGDPRHIGQVHESGVGWPELQAHLAHGFEKRQALDVAHRAADLDDRHLEIGRTAPHEILDLVGDMRDHLHGLAQVVAASLFLEHALVDLARREVVRSLHPRRDEALVVAEVEVGLGTVVGDENLAVLERAHRARIDVEVGVELDQGDVQAARFEDRRQRRRGDALAEGGHHTAGDEDVLGHVVQHPCGTALRGAGMLCW